MLRKCSENYKVTPDAPKTSIARPGCCPQVCQLQAGCQLWSWCTGELHVLNEEYTCQWHLYYRCTAINEITC